MTSPPTYYVVFADDNHDLKVVAVPAANHEIAARKVLKAIGFWADTEVFEQAPLTHRHTKPWSLDELEDYYG